MKFAYALRLMTLIVTMFAAEQALARIYVSPFVSTSSTKKISPAKTGSGKETSSTAQRTTYGINAGVSFWKLFSLQLSVGRAQLDQTTKTQDAADDFSQIDLEEDLKMDTSDPDSEVRKVEITDKAGASVMIDPGFWIFIARAKVGVQALRRTVSLTQDDVTTNTTPPILYKPLAGGGFGIRLSPKMKAMAEYQFFFYNYPELKPFEREVSITYSISI